MNLERNLIDNILESEVKLGHADMPITFYYPSASLSELLGCDESELESEILKFCEEEADRFGKITIEELANEKGRYAVTVPVYGVKWVHDNFEPGDFMKSFITEIKKPFNTIDNIINLFRCYSKETEVNQVSEDEWSLSFSDESIDPYVYHVEKNVFGLEYHRFTREAYRKTILEE
ncbi:MAG: DUF3877 family protein [Clostridia bacterium]|nr:DUF3877 family protein [Clostridia bacterium]